MSSARIGHRIVITTQGDRWIATIASTIPSWQRQSLEIWFGAWVALGAMLVYGMVTFPGSERTFYGICLGFLSYFEFRAWKAVRWRRFGMEVMQLSPDGLELRLDHGTCQGRPQLIPLSNVNEAQVSEPNARSFFESMDQQFWVIGGDRIHITAQGKTYVFGKQLNVAEAQQLAKAFNQKLKKLRRSSEKDASKN